MKKLKKVIGSTLLILSVVASATVFAASDVRFTVHNLSNNNNQATGMTFSAGPGTTRTFYSSNVDQVCIFCHTPHNSQPAAPLWNKATLAAATNFKLYTSSDSLTPATKLSALTAGSPSLLCLGCHDGKTAINVLHNSSAGVPAATNGAPGYAAGDMLVDIAGTYAPRSIQYFGFGSQAAGNLGASGPSGAALTTGDNLTDDHPIGFVYADAWNVKQAALNSTGVVATKSSNRVKFFGGKMECSSCHDPHVKYDPTVGGGDAALRPFLVMSNVGSALCLACHNK